MVKPSFCPWLNHPPSFWIEALPGTSLEAHRFRLGADQRRQRPWVGGVGALRGEGAAAKQALPGETMGTWGIFQHQMMVI